MADEPTPSSSLFPDSPPRSSGDASETESSYLVTARKYRPQTFGEMVGQTHVAQTLCNAIRLDRLAHAYLFSGPRGVGKTTAARILAKAVNCTTPLEERENAEPCRACDSCKTFEAGRSMNIIEIDAASNNSVDDIRELRDTVRIPPQGAKKKIYILDEVHMLSKGAFNALLKTLEEPPPYVLFIFATTEPHKVLPTILSRTQRFDFRRISIIEIIGQLRAICAAESIETDDESLLLLARKADGALRDAFSLFDQAVSLCGSPLEAAALREALGVVDTEIFFEVTDKAAARDRAGLLELVERLVSRGYDLPEFLGGLADHLRNLLVARSTGKGDLIEATDATRTQYVEAARSRAEADLLHLLMMVEEAARNIKASRQPRLAVELALLKMASLETAADLEELIGKLSALEAMPANGDRPTQASPSVTPQTTAEPSVNYEPEKQEKPTQELPRTEPDVAPDDESENEPPAFSPEPPRALAANSPAPQPASAASAPAHSGLFGAPALQVRRNSSGDSSGDPSGDGSDGPEAVLAVAGDVAVAEAHAATADLDVPLGRIKALWPDLVQTIKADRIHVGTLLQQAEPKRVVRGSIEVTVPDKFSCTLLESEAAKFASALSGLLEEKSPPLRFVVDASPGREPARDVDPFERFKQLRHENPVIQALFEKFGAEIVW
ncbi:MAG: DNA polymerase III subunit gamma/tau [Bacteroidetes bacterium]|nr:DNA polymerase III subunit gamma/tau [Bacteroidota bacterium]